MNLDHKLSVAAIALMLVGAPYSSALAETIAIIGTGNVAQALGPEFAAQGHRIVYGSRNPDRDEVSALVARTGGDASATSQRAATEAADVIVLAVPWQLVAEVVGNLGDLSGKIVIDPTNPRQEMPDGLLYFGVETSNTQIVQELAPDARVVKAFNTMTWRTMVEPESTGGAVTVPLAGNDIDAKAFVADLVAGMGLEPLDLGPARNSRLIEGMYLLWRNGINLGTPFNYHLRRAP
jgi:predicted dinucleotide-binding enzyme